MAAGETVASVTVVSVIVAVVVVGVPVVPLRRSGVLIGWNVTAGVGAPWVLGRGAGFVCHGNASGVFCR
ncbi:hypothetical protein AB0D67_09375 [Streptosporangium sp. NPDC048047]|uniref:hypothetical protein n=1 Tax=Streptosporangium sp. NPDC048047 TaxID=3155748 RepID=UPI0034232151